MKYLDQVQTVGCTIPQYRTCLDLGPLVAVPFDVAGAHGDLLGVIVGEQDRHAAVRVWIVADNRLSQAEADDDRAGIVNHRRQWAHDDLV